MEGNKTTPDDSSGKAGKKKKKTKGVLSFVEDDGE